jgi:putative ABC transport system permease protein
VGLVLGLGFVAIVRNVLGMPTALSPGIMLSAFLCAVGVGLVFGLFPAMRAGRLNPVEALRYE